jgi:OOP family OmpA-OmpF porin
MNMKFAFAAALGAISLATITPQAAAADNGFYIGAGITQTEFDIDDIGSGELDDNSFKVIAGFRPLDWLAVEANYIDLGSLDDSGVELDTSVITLSALFLKEFAVLDIYARAGMANWKADASVAGPGGGSIDDDGWEPTFGVGIGAHFGSLGLRAEYERFSADIFDGALDSDISTISLAFTYTFL